MRMWVRFAATAMSAIGVCGALTLAYPRGVSAADTPPQVSKDGLQLKIHTKNELVYVKPGATFDQYKRVMILDCYVAMAKDWQQNYNANAGDDLDLQVTDSDVQRIESTLSEEFKKVFAAELKKGGYQVTTSAAPDVLILRPAIVNVRVTAPDLMSAGMNTNVITSAGSGTFYLELWAPPHTLLARAMDAQADQTPFAQPGNSVTNMEAADTILKKWADILVRHLDSARGKPPSV
jgi:hypothetical protein